MGPKNCEKKRSSALLCLKMFKNVLWVKEHPHDYYNKEFSVRKLCFSPDNCHSFIYSVSGFNVVDDVHVSWKIASGKCFPKILCILI